MGATRSWRWIVKWHLGILCTWLFSVPFIHADESNSLSPLAFITEEYPPYNYWVDNQLRGTSVDLLEAIFELTQTPLTRQDIHYYPWVRGYELALHQANTVLFSTTRTAAREAHFHWVGPIAQDRVVLLAHRDAPVVIDSLADAIERGLKVTVIREDIGAQALIEANYPGHLMLPAIDNRSALHMLMRGRVDLWAYSADVAEWIVESEGYANDSLIPVHTLSESSLYFAINLATDPRLVTRMQQALDNIKVARSNR